MGFFRWIYERLFLTKCDRCSGWFDVESLYPTSGDWWFCGSCMDEIFEEYESQSPTP